MQRADLAARVPQRERVTYLSHLQARFAGDVRTTTGFGVINQELVLNVIPVLQKGTRGPLPKARVVGCCYDRRSGGWWFYWLATGRRIAPANELDAAARIVLKAGPA
ncbi:hypothetical protein [Actinomadura rubrisoli]|uniref:Uncharacterized protein n=1 Tax=Actinomadura rubrisoli TaxID=2530368 RepID=A0A4R5C4K3_9ACTN|nr:hypothetical protein [Actinomadura rubrisoli]TDD93013.1 hypothetical protein E1298_10380 [Actinomadura rubrisoli]